MWIFRGDEVNATTAALIVISLMLLTSVVSWDDIVKNSAAWNTLAWFATLVALADGLTRVGFVKWFAQTVASQLTDTPPAIAVAMLLLINFFGHYLFASVTAHVTAMIPVLLAVASTIPGVNMHTLALGLCLAARHHGYSHALRERAKPGVLRQRLSAGGGLLAPGRDFRRDLLRRVSGHRRSLDAGHTVIDGGSTVYRRDRKREKTMASNEFRIEHDFLGDREVPADAYYGVQTLRGTENFHITGMPISRGTVFR